MKESRALLLAVFGLSLLITACGGGSSTSSSAAVTISPTTTTAVLGTTVQFTATVTGSTNTTVTWQVNGTTGGASATGTISTGGVYTAPASVPNPSVVQITAVSAANTQATASASVTIVSANPTTIPPAAAVISPSFAQLAAGAQQAFTVTVNGQPAPVTWSIQCPGTNSDCGSITAAGLYTAPLSPPPGARLNILATPADTTVNASSVAVDVQYSAATLTGVYAFSAAGSGSSGFLAEAGALAFDGKGGITAGSIDSSLLVASPAAVTGGSYRVGVGGRGAATIQTAAGSETWQIVMVNHSRGYVLRFDAAGRQASGTLDLQDATPAIASLQGKYALTLDGVAAGTTSAVAIAGAIAANGAGAISSGVIDASDGTTITSAAAATGTFTAPSAIGRGTLTLTSSLGTQTIAYYMVNAKRIKLLESDATRVARGELFVQAAGPFTATSLNSGLAFILSGGNNHHPSAFGGVVVADGAGNFKSGSLDSNDNGTITTEQAFTGTYTVTDPNSGRTTATWTIGAATQHLVLYPRNDGGWNTLRVDANTALHGSALTQIGQSINISTLTGSLGITADGASLTALPAGTGLAGQIALAATDTFTGLADVNSGGTATPDISLQGAGFAVKPNGRAATVFSSSSATLGGGTLAIYVVDANNAFCVELDGTRTLAGFLQKQF